MMKACFYVTLATMFFCSSVLAEMPDLGGFLKAATTSPVSISDLLSTKAKVLSGYISSMQELTSALEKAATAFGVKGDVVAKLADIKALTPKNISDSLLEKARQSSQAILDTIKSKMQNTATLPAGSANLFAGSLKSLSGVIQNIKNLMPQVNNLVGGAGKALISASGQDKTKIQDILSLGSVISKSLPSDLKTVGAIVSVFNQYATAHNIPLL
ncbi:MAG: hypothetical protein NTZ48_03260 [Candidatus Omnitrophica bacterium]|nr:hypothetical protein [Candidatus Omnitrophota bacterium]